MSKRKIKFGLNSSRQILSEIATQTLVNPCQPNTFSQLNSESQLGVKNKPISFFGEELSQSQIEPLNNINFQKAYGIIDLLSLIEPTFQTPGYWTCRNEFIWVSNKVIQNLNKLNKSKIEIRLKCLIYFSGHQLENHMFSEEPVKEFKNMSDKEKKKYWPYILKLNQNKRKNWMKTVIKKFQKFHFDFPTVGLKVSKVSNNMYAQLNIEQLKDIFELHENNVFNPFIKIKVDSVI